MKRPELQAKTISVPTASPRYCRQTFTIPNIICLVRLGGSFGLAVVAWQGKETVFLCGFIVLAMSDWVDGKLAILLNQRSEFGARLDSWADAALFTALLFGAVLLRSTELKTEILWIIPAISSYLISTAAGFWKYRRWPSYHTRAAKTSWLFILLGTIGLFTQGSLWLLRLALVAVTLTNLEALLITLISPQWRANVSSVYQAWRDTR